MLQAGQVIAGRYLLASSIGEGAMGAVWRAEDQTLRRQVAIKFLFVRIARDPQAMVDQFLREARIAASVQHRNVIHTVDFGTMDQYQPFMVMELLDGESLGDRFAREPPLTHEQTIHVVSLTLRGLAAVHDAGIVHRDLKPQNIFLQRDSDAVYPKILDFGISRSLEQRGERPSAIATQEGMIVGTPDYMSPEQARGEPSIDKRADLYSMAVILYEGLTGQLPFQAETLGDLIVKLVTQEPPSMREVCPDIPQSLSDMVAQAMAKQREHRFSDARAMRRALLSAAEAAMSAGRRAGASAPPELGTPEQQAPSPRAAGAGQAVSTQAATWGDFEGLNAGRILDGGPPPSGLVSPGAKPQRIVARLGDQIASARPRPPVPAFAPNGAPDLLDLPAPPDPPPAERASAGDRVPARKPRKAAAKPASDAALGDALDPLYAGVEQAAPDIDYDRVLGPGRKPVPASAPRAKAKASARGRSKQAAAPASANYYARMVKPWILPLAALLLSGYALGLPPLRSARGARPLADPASASAPAGPSLFGGGADPGLKQLRLQIKGRRANPGKAPAHMRDVVF